MASEQAMALYRKLNSSGTAITSNNWREWDRLASSAMKMPDFTPAGQSESLHDLANEVGIEIQALKSRASRPGAKDMMAVEEGQVDVDGVKYRVLPYQLEYFKTDLAKFDDPNWRKQVVQKYLAKNYIKRFSRPGAKARFKVEDRFYFGKGRKDRFASISMPRQSVTSSASGTWKKREVTVRGKKAWLVELHRGSVLVGYLNQHPDTRQFHAFDGNTDQQIGVGGEAEMKRLVESL